MLFFSDDGALLNLVLELLDLLSTLIFNFVLLSLEFYAFYLRMNVLHFDMKYNYLWNILNF